MKIVVFWFKFYWILFPRVNHQHANIGLDNDLATDRWQIIIFTKV